MIVLHEINDVADRSLKARSIEAFHEPAALIFEGLGLQYQEAGQVGRCDLH